MIYKYLLVLMFGANLSWAAPQDSGIVFDKTTDSPEIPTFRKDYTYEAETETFYKEHTTSKNWSEAIAACKLEGAKLAMPFTKTEADLIQKHFTGKTYYTWLGIHDRFTEGKFVTLNGTRVTDIYTNWNTGEPNNAGGIEDCAVMTGEGKYNDIPCDLECTFICTKHQSEITRNYDCETTDKAYFYENEAQRCYKIHTTPKTWREAYSICDNEEASLAMANSQAEADLFIKYLDRYPESTLRGNFIKDAIILDFSDIITRGEFLTSNGKTLEESGYSAWLEDQPGSLDDKEHCGSMRRDGKLNSLGCEERALFICEKPLKLPIQLIDIRFGNTGGVKNRYSK